MDKKYHEKILEIMKPMMDSTPITYFCYAVADRRKGTHAMLSSLAEHQSVRSKENIPLAVTYLEEGYYWWNIILTEESLNQYKSFGVDNLFLIVKKNGSFYESYTFGTSLEYKDVEMVNFYINHMPLLDKFIAYFNEEGEELIEEIQNSMVKTTSNLSNVGDVDPAFFAKKGTHSVKRQIKKLEEMQNKPQADVKSALQEELKQAQKKSMFSGIRNLRSLFTLGADKLNISSMDRKSAIDDEEDIKRILNKLKTPMCWLIAQITSKAGRQKIQKGYFKFLKSVFVYDDKSCLAVNQFGSNANEFIKSSKTNFQGKLNFEPLDESAISLLYESFDKICQDLENDDRWVPFWDKMISYINVQEEADSNSSKEILENIYTLKNMVKEAYLDIVFQAAEVKPQKEMDKVQALLQNQRYTQLLRQILRAKQEELTVLVCYERMIDSAKEKLIQNVQNSINKLNAYVKEGMLYKSSIQEFDKEYEKNKASFESVMLGEKIALPIVEKLHVRKEHYGDLINLIKEQMKQMVKESLPNVQKGAHGSFESTVKKAADVIMQSQAMRSLPEIGSYILKNHMLNKSANDYVHRLIIESRIEYFSQFIPNNMEMLESTKLGLNWIIYLRGRIDAIMAIYGKYFLLDPQKKKPGGLSVYQSSRLLNILQTIFLDTHIQMVKNSLEDDEPVDFEQIKSEIEQSPLLASDSKSQITGLSEGAIQEKISDIELLVLGKQQRESIHPGVNKPARKDQSLLFSNATSPEFDITVGLVKVVGDKYQREEVALSEKDYEGFYEKTHDITTELAKLLRNKSEHDTLKRKVEEMGDLSMKLEVILTLYDSATEPEIYSDFAFIQEKEAGHIVTPTQKSAIECLQELYIETLNDYWKQEASKGSPSQNEQTQLPNSISDEKKEEIYFDILKPAIDEPIVNDPRLPDRVMPLVEQIFGMQDALMDIPESAN